MTSHKALLEEIALDRQGNGTEALPQPPKVLRRRSLKGDEKPGKWRGVACTAQMDVSQSPKRIKRTQKCRRRALPASSCESKLSVCPAVHLSRKKERKAQWGRGPIECEVCGRSIRCRFTHLPYLKRHLLRHAGKKMHMCDQCGKGFIQKYHLERHLLLHTGKTPYTCDECGATFTRTDYLRMHMRNTHLGHGKRAETFFTTCEGSSFNFGNYIINYVLH
uniref:C2H2-type domain-containing protein n=1 Tax=Electrophorus electricus TaxID=8005 RepID=A0AAY5F028_ELEEL